MAERTSRAPALIASVALHAAILGSTLIAWPWGTKLKPVEVTPVTLLTAADVARLSAAEQAEVPEAAQTPDPAPEAPPEPVAETPAPRPEPAPAARPAPAPPTPLPPKPAPPKPAPTPTPKATTPVKPQPPAPSKPTPTQRVDLNKLAQSLTQTPARPAGAARSSADRGNLDRIEKDLQSRQADGAARAATANALGAISAKLQRLWNPNCGIDGASDIQIRVRIHLEKNGRLAEHRDRSTGEMIRAGELVDYRSINDIKDPVIKAAASRTLTAVSRGAPYEGLPVADYDSWKVFVVRFDGKEACRG